MGACVEEEEEEVEEKDDDDDEMTDKNILARGFRSTIL